MRLFRRKPKAKYIDIKTLSEIERLARTSLNKSTARKLKAAMIDILDMCRADLEDRVYRAWVDGSCIHNPDGPGGWAYILQSPDGAEKTGGGHDKKTTNNRMEMMAAISAIESVRKGAIIRVRTDSQYVQRGVEEWMTRWKANGWKTADRKPVKNEDLWRRLDKAQAKRDVVWIWIKGHAANPMNERVDMLARGHAREKR
jgi:ribonuclease HI